MLAFAKLYHEKLINNNELLNYFCEMYGISQRTVKYFYLGIDDNKKIMVPIINQHGIIDGIIRYDDGIEWIKDSIESKIYNIPTTKEVYICENIPDVWLIKEKYNKTGTVILEYTNEIKKFFKDKIIYCYEDDLEIIKNLYEIATQIKVIKQEEDKKKLLLNLIKMNYENYLKMQKFILMNLNTLHLKIWQHLFLNYALLESLYHPIEKNF